MNQNFRLGEVDGIPVGANWSVVVIFFLFAWELAALILPDDHPHQSQAVYWSVAILTTVVLFASLLAHEVSHAVVAKRNGIGVRQITLWLFGGVSELESDALTPAVDFRVAVAGPLTTFVLAGVFGVFGLLFRDATGTMGVAASAVGWLAWINLFLGAFNLLPGAPLDGGRVLRAALWKRTGDRVGAASRAADAGEVIGFVLVGLGVLEFLTVSFVGLWLVLMGWFLLSAARAEKNDVVMRSSLAGIHVADVMTRDPMTFASTTTVAQLVDDQLHHFRFSTYPLVAPDGRLEGLATMARIRHVPPHLRPTTRLIDIACPMSEVPIGSPGEPIPELLQRMQPSPDGRALVLDADGRLVGIVSPSDISRLVQLSMLRSQGRGASKT